MDAGSVAGIIGVVAGLKAVFPKVTAYWTVLLAVVVGGVAGYLGINGLNVVSGVTAGLMAVGVHEGASRIGGK